MTKSVDVIIIGSGIPGLSLAISLARAGLQVMVMDRDIKHEKIFTGAFDLRVSAINPASKKIFQKLNVWPTIEAARLEPVKKILVWDSVNQADITFRAEESGHAALFYIIENSLITYALLDTLKKLNQVEIIAPVNLKTLTVADDGVHVITQDGKTFTAKLIIGADGAQSWVRDQIGIELQERDYHQQAIVATIGTELPHHHTAYQCFLPTGPLAFLPLPDQHQCSIVWSSTQAEELLKMSSEKFIEALSTPFENILGALSLLSERKCFPLQMRHAKEYVSERVALIGDAAHTIHPLAGQGLNLGIADAACLADVIINAHAKHRQFYSKHTLNKYARERKAENLKMIFAMEAFHQLFTRDNALIIKARSAGLNLVDEIPILKRFFVSQTGR